MEGTWTIGELAAAATETLGGEPVQVNGRVRDMPNERLIRWYTTIALIDPPLARRGRIALYGRRHLLQLVAVKRRQAAGRTIAQIQAELAGATDDLLQSIAGLAADTTPSPPPAPTAPSRRFWATPPAPPSPYDSPYDAGRPGAELVHGVRLAPGVTLLLDGAAPGSDDLAAIEAAAAALLDVLGRRGLPRPSARTQPNGNPAPATTRETKSSRTWRST
ncbi:MAG: transcriptional regulator, MerR family [Streptosporangiaceae bacterium]|nr:transcriptional regulator, MerR family [Streptosporangiaceae bacterium]